MTCPHCQAPFAIKAKFLAKTCVCDEDERFISFENWYSQAFKVDLPMMYDVSDYKSASYKVYKHYNKTQ